MEIRFKIYALILLLLAINKSVNCQPQAEGEASFLFLLKTQNISIDQPIKKSGWGESSWLELYAMGADKANFEAAKNDEFKRSKYIAATRDKINKKLKDLSFTKEYSLLTESQFGEYNFSLNSFPITSFFQGHNYRGLELANSFQVPLKIGWIINQSLFDYKIPISAEKAEALINNRKLQNGTINRTIDTKIYFTYVNQPLITGKSIGYKEYVFSNTELIVYITKIEFYNNGQLLSSITPTAVFEDPVSGFKVLNGEEVIYYGDETIVVRRTNGIPNGQVNYFKDNKISRISDCSYFFPTSVKYSGDDVLYIGEKEKDVPYSISQYNPTGKPQGYQIQFLPNNNFILMSVINIDENGVKNKIYEYSVFSNPKKLNEMPSQVQELIKKYDFGHFFEYSIISSSNVNNISQTENQEKITPEKTIQPTTDYGNILISNYTQDVVKEYIIGNTSTLHLTKKTNFELQNILFLFPNKANSIEYLPQVTTHYIIWLRNTLNLSTLSMESFKPDSSLQVEIYFTQKFNSTITGGDTFWYADLTTHLYISKNNKKIKAEVFTNSTPMFSGKRDKWDALEDAITKSEKKLGKILGDLTISE